MVADKHFAQRLINKKFLKIYDIFRKIDLKQAKNCRGERPTIKYFTFAYNDF